MRKTIKLVEKAKENMAEVEMGRPEREAVSLEAFLDASIGNVEKGKSLIWIC